MFDLKDFKIIFVDLLESSSSKLKLYESCTNIFHRNATIYRLPIAIIVHNMLWAIAYGPAKTQALIEFHHITINMIRRVAQFGINSFPFGKSALPVFVEPN